LSKALLQKSTPSVQLIYQSQRCFGPKKAGGPQVQASPIPYERNGSVIENFIKEGHEFVLGPPIHPNKTRGAPRDHLLQKLEPKIDAYAKKLREMYHREGTYDP